MENSPQISVNCCMLKVDKMTLFLLLHAAKNALINC